MNRVLNRNLWLPGVVALFGLMALQAFRQQQATEVGERLFSEKVNLALRYTAHRLLASAGNHTGAIPPVENPEETVWVVRLEQNFDYDSVPHIIREAFALHHVEGEYNVAVINCQTDDLMLGFTASTSRDDTGVPCAGRDQMAGCFNLRVSFPDRPGAGYLVTAWPWTGVLLLLVLVAWGIVVLFRRGKRTATPVEEPVLPPELAPLLFGQSVLDVQNQKLVVNGSVKNLTYRETKLLRLFCEHANILLDRDQILRLVWEDEGIIVGRSVDVFVSRLRKLLKEDETVKISNVHGVGYRLEVTGSGNVTS